MLAGWLGERWRMLRRERNSTRDSDGS
jgi:hypothetical protein